MAYKELNLLGCRCTILDIPEIQSIVKSIIEEDRKEIIANHNLHSIYLVNNNPELSAFWEKAYVTHIDGMPLVWWGKILGYPLQKKHRITYLDWIYPLLDMADRNRWDIFYLGSKPGVANRAIEKLSKTYDKISFSARHGYFDAQPGSKDNQEILADINSFRPNILMVGMGMPRQEKWILNHGEALDANVILNCGACFDYIAGVQKSPPRIYGKLGLEWFYRFVNDPRRLFGRYFLEPFGLLPYVIKDLKNKRGS